MKIEKTAAKCAHRPFYAFPLLKKKYFCVRIEKLHKMASKLLFFCPQKVEKIGNHSNFIFECNTARAPHTRIDIPNVTKNWKLVEI